MSANFVKYLEHEKQMLVELIALAKSQQQALIKFDMDSMVDISQFHQQIAGKLKKAEEKRIDMLAKWLNINRLEAQKMKLSDLERFFGDEEKIQLQNVRKQMKELVDQLLEINKTNRILGNRARSSVSQMLSALTNGSNQMCNVRI